MSTYNQNGDGIIGDVEPGKRVKGVIEKLRSGDAPDMSQASSVVPDNPGPAVAGRTPVLGGARRERGAPVLRDQLPSFMDD